MRSRTPLQTPFRIITLFILAPFLVPATADAAADYTFNLKVHAYCMEDHAATPCFFASEDALREHVRQRVREMNTRWSYNGISFHLAATDIVYDSTYSLISLEPGGRYAVADQPAAASDGTWVAELENYWKATDPAALHIYLIPNLETSFSRGVTQPGVFCDTYHLGGAWAHEMGHAFTLPHTFTFQDQAEVGGTPARDGDGFTDTLDDPGVREGDNPNTSANENDLGNNGFLRYGHEFCRATQNTTVPLHPDSWNTTYCDITCVERLDTGGEQTMSIPFPQPYNALTYYDEMCHGPYTLDGWTVFYAFTPQQRTAVRASITSQPERSILTDICASGPDSDCDGVCDYSDNCDSVRNPDQENSDGDGLGDACDVCPHDPANPDLDGDGICDPDDSDRDGDGCPQVCLDGVPCPGIDLRPDDDTMVVGTFLNVNCPHSTSAKLSPEGAQDTDGDGLLDCYDADDDGDGLLDEADHCPLVADPANNAGLCTYPGQTCGLIPENWRVICMGGGCNAFLLRLRRDWVTMIEEVAVFEGFRLVDDVFYIPVGEGRTPAEVGRLFMPSEGGPGMSLVLDPGVIGTARRFIPVASWNADSIAFAGMAEGKLLTLRPGNAILMSGNEAAATGPALTVDTAFAVGVPRDVPLPDGDGDGIPDTSDNCLTVKNAQQADADGDGFGDVCDPDFNNDGRVGRKERRRMEACLGTSLRAGIALLDWHDDGTLPARATAARIGKRQICRPMDLNGDGRVTLRDERQLRRYLRRGRPGPSGLTVVAAE